MREKPSEAQYSECTFMANFGYHCGHGEGCGARAIKKSILSVKEKFPPAKKEQIRSQIEQAAAQSGCPNYPADTHSAAGDRMGHEVS